MPLKLTAVDLRRGVKAAALLAAPAVLGGCGALARYGSPLSGSAAPASLVQQCKEQADRAAEATAVDALPPNPPAKNALGAYVGNALARPILRRRSYNRCMESAGYVRVR